LRFSVAGIGIGKHVNIYLSDKYLAKLEVVKKHLAYKLSKQAIVEVLKSRGVDVSKFDLNSIGDVIRLLIDVAYIYVVNPPIILIDFPANNPKNKVFNVVVVAKESEVEKIGSAIDVIDATIFSPKIGFSRLALFGLDDDLWSKFMEILNEQDKRLSKLEKIDIDELEVSTIENADVAIKSMGVEVRCSKCGNVITFLVHNVIKERKRIDIDETCRKCGTKVKAVVRVKHKRET